MDKELKEYINAKEKRIRQDIAIVFIALVVGFGSLFVFLICLLDLPLI